MLTNMGVLSSFAVARLKLSMLGPLEIAGPGFAVKAVLPLGNACYNSGMFSDRWGCCVRVWLNAVLGRLSDNFNVSRVIKIRDIRE